MSGANPVLLDAGTFSMRWKKFSAEWDACFDQEQSPWYKVDSIVLLSGKQEEDRLMPKTEQLHIWLFGYVFAETLIVALRHGKIYCVCGPRKQKKNDDKNEANIHTVCNAIKQMRDGNFQKHLLRIGCLRGKNEKADGVFANSVETAFLKFLVDSQETSIDTAIAELLAVQDSKGLECSAMAACLAVRLTQEILINRVEMILDNELSEPHTELVSRVEKAIDDKKRQDRWKSKYNLDPAYLDLVYVNVQSGPKCELKLSAQPTDLPVSTKPGTILLSLGTKYKDFTANITRTLLFNAEKEKRVTYQLTLEILEYTLDELVIETSFGQLYEKVRNYVQEKDPYLAPYFSRYVGHVLGLEFREPSLTLNEKSNGVVKAGMIFNISVGFANVPSKDNPNDIFSIWLADTVEILSKGKPKVLTADSDKRLKSINYEIADEDQNTVPGNNLPSKPRGSPSSKTGSNGPLRQPSNRQDDRKGVDQRPQQESVVIRDRLRSRTKNTTADEADKLLDRQKQLRQRKVKEIKERFRDGKGLTKATSKRSVKKMSTLAAYRDASDYPRELKFGRVCNFNELSVQIYLDVVRETLLVPILGFGHTPFHVATIRNILCQAEDKKVYTVRIQFQVPGTVGFGYKSEDNPFPDITGPEGMFIKELIYKSTNREFLNEQFFKANLPQLSKNFKELQKRIKQREESGDLNMELATQQALELNKKGGRRILLKNVMAKTGTLNRRVAGTLEAHLNGLRFSGGRTETIDLTYSNIKHAIFQPCENELIILIHFHLKNPILVNKKKTSDIQFYTEVGAQTDDLDQRRGQSTYDPDEIAEEQRERELKKRLNFEFKKFVESVEEIIRGNQEKLEFEIPFRDLGFYGVPKNSSQLILPTSYCLVQLTEWPVFVLELKDVELVSFERVFHGLRQFDITFVFKRWLNEIEMIWYESKGNLNWSEILKTIREDVTGFAEDGAFEIFLGEERPKDETDQESGTDSESDDGEEYEYVASESSGEVASSDDENLDDDDEESLVDENESTEGEVSDASEEEEEGLTWDELERRAVTEDRKRGRQQEEHNDDHEDKRWKKKKE